MGLSDSIAVWRSCGKILGNKIESVCQVHISWKMSNTRAKIFLGQTLGGWIKEWLESYGNSTQYGQGRTLLPEIQLKQGGGQEDERREMMQEVVWIEDPEFKWLERKKSEMKVCKKEVPITQKSEVNFLWSKKLSNWFCVSSVYGLARWCRK